MHTVMEIDQLDYGLHHHPEFEISAFQEASGVRIVGDHVEEFRNGDILFLPPNLPHNSRFSSQKATIGKVTLHVIKFSLHNLTGLLELPDMATIKQLLLKNRGGYNVIPHNKKQFMLKLDELGSSEPAKSLSIFIEILYTIAQCCDIRELSTTETGSNNRQKDRMEQISQFLQEHFRESVTLENIASFINLTPQSCSRYFSNTMGKTFSAYLNEVRIAHACNQLLDTNESIISVAFDSGYSSLTNFNRRFKALRGVTPKEYRKKYTP